MTLHELTTDEIVTNYVKEKYAAERRTAMWWLALAVLIGVWAAVVVLWLMVLFR